MHPAQDVGYDVRLSRNVVDGKVELLESVLPSNLTGGRFGHSLEVLQCGAVGVDDDWESVQVVSPFGSRFHEGEEFFLVDGVVNFVFVELSGHTNHEA